MTKLKQLKLLMAATRIIMDSGVCPKSPRNFADWFSMVRYAHSKGYLYVGFEGDDIDLAAIACRVPSIYEGMGDDLPAEESGNILYVSIVASSSKDKLKLTRLLRFYLKDNPDVTEIAYHQRGDDNKLKRFRLRSVHGQIIEA